jgi:hypothetical protein
MPLDQANFKWVYMAKRAANIKASIRGSITVHTLNRVSSRCTSVSAWAQPTDASGTVKWQRQVLTGYIRYPLSGFPTGSVDIGPIESFSVGGTPTFSRKCMWLALLNNARVLRYSIVLIDNLLCQEYIW